VDVSSFGIFVPIACRLPVSFTVTVVKGIVNLMTMGGGGGTGH
jgi:hypothetical protein